MDMKRELEELEGELRAILPSITAKRPELIHKLAATNLANRYDCQGLLACVPYPVCGDIIKVSRIEIDDDKGGIKGAAWIGCSRGCTLERLNYGL